MGIAPEAGRVFTPEEYYPGPVGRVIMITHGLWMHRFGGDAKVLNRSLELSGIPCVVIGIVPKDSSWPESAEIPRPNG
jgi:hypothetical protein